MRPLEDCKVKYEIRELWIVKTILTGTITHLFGILPYNQPDFSLFKQWLTYSYQEELRHRIKLSKKKVAWYCKASRILIKEGPKEGYQKNEI